MLALYYIWSCDVAGCETIFRLSVGKEMPLHAHVLEHTHLPVGWHYINGNMICPKHEIVIDPEAANEPA